MVRRPITGCVPNVRLVRDTCQQLSKSVLSQRRRYDMATYINPEATHIIFCRVNLWNREATCSITELYKCDLFQTRKYKAG
jgi:hypothetical protein